MSLRGTVVLAQEHRLQVVDNSGRHWSISLGPQVPWGPQELRELARDGALVDLRIEDSHEGSRSHVASRMEVLARRRTR
jgi:hypothetical protein